MILPNKHISLECSILGAGAAILRNLDAPMTPTAVWEKVKNAPEIGMYSRYITTLDFLYAIAAIDLEEGLIVKRSSHD